MIKLIAIVVVFAIVGILLYATTRPDSFSVRRTASIPAAPAQVFALVNDFRRWSSWSPWEKLDPDMKRSFSGAEQGQGAVYAWEGNKKVGAGRMEILAAETPSRVEIKLDFIRPFEGHNVTQFSFVPQGDATQVDWVMSGPSPYITKLMGIFVSMDAMIGKDFEAGLANMRQAVAAKPGALQP
jgi:uncharacterized protein YndB with AHSA1/START domain